MARTLSEIESSTIRSVLDYQGRRYEWLAKQLEMDPSLLTHALARRRSVPDNFLKRVSTLLGIPIEAGERVA